MGQHLTRRRPTIDDIVRLSGVSRSSVFRYLNGKKLRPSLMASVETAMRRLGYLSADDTEKTAFEIFLSTSSQFGSFRGYAEVVEGIVARAVDVGGNVRFGPGSGFEEGKGLPERTSNQRIGVVILGKTIEEEEKEVAYLRRQGIPFVLVNRMMDDAYSSFVSVDFFQAAKDAVQHLFSLGRTRIALWDDGSNVFRMQREKYRGYLAAYDEQGIPVPEELTTSKTMGELEDEAARLLSFSHRPDGWFAMDDRVAMRVIRVARSLGLRVPEDLAVIGMNDIETASISRPSISSVHIPFFEAGWTAVDVLARLIERPVERTIRIVLGHSVVPRESSVGKK